MPEVAKILPNYLNYAVCTLKGYKLVWRPDPHWGRKYRLQLPDGEWEGKLESGRWFRTMALTEILGKFPSYATDLVQAWSLMPDLPYNVRADILRDEWDTDNPADLAYKITSVWIIAKNKDNPTGAADDWWDKIATFVPRADSEFGTQGDWNE